MPIYRLTKELIFPHPYLSDENGLLAIGGDLSPDRLLLAYSMGIFPWFNENDPILWWSPDPRFVLFPEKVKVSRSTKKLMKKDIFDITFDTAFRSVINKCSKTRQDATWITPQMQEGYIKLHELGFAHSVEVWHEGHLVGGLYGVTLGKCFFGESMFSLMSNASKLALINLCQELLQKEFLFIDCQVYTKHLESMGAEMISRVDFLELLKKGLSFQTTKGLWQNI